MAPLDRRGGLVQKFAVHPKHRAQTVSQLLCLHLQPIRLGQQQLQALHISAVDLGRLYELGARVDLLNPLAFELQQKEIKEIKFLQQIKERLLGREEERKLWEAEKQARLEERKKKIEEAERREEARR